MEIVIETLVLWSLLETPKRNAYVEEKMRRLLRALAFTVNHINTR